MNNQFITLLENVETPIPEKINAIETLTDANERNKTERKENFRKVFSPNWKSRVRRPFSLQPSYSETSKSEIKSGKSFYKINLAAET